MTTYATMRELIKELHRATYLLHGVTMYIGMSWSMGLSGNDRGDTG